MQTLTLPHLTNTQKEQQNVKYMVTLFEENIKTVACTTWNECKLKSGVQTPAAEAVQGRKVKAQPHSSKHHLHPGARRPSGKRKSLK